MAIKKAKKQPVNDSKNTEMEPTKITEENAPLYTVKILDLILHELRVLNKLMKKAVTE